MDIKKDLNEQEKDETRNLKRKKRKFGQSDTHAMNNQRQPQRGSRQQNNGRKPQRSQPNSGGTNSRQGSSRQGFPNAQSRQGNKGHTKGQDSQDSQDSGLKKQGSISDRDLRNQRENPSAVQQEPIFKHVILKYECMIFDTFAQAQSELETLRQKAQGVDQLNVVIRAEGPMDDPILLQIPKVKVFAGAAWTLIHERRIADGWYSQPR